MAKEEEERIEELRARLIKLLKEEIKFLEETSMSYDEMKNYRYGVCSDGKEYRRF